MVPLLPELQDWKISIAYFSQENWIPWDPQITHLIMWFLQKLFNLWIFCQQPSKNEDLNILQRIYCLKIVHRAIWRETIFFLHFVYDTVFLKQTIKAPLRECRLFGNWLFQINTVLRLQSHQYISQSIASYKIHFLHHKELDLIHPTSAQINEV